MSVAIKGLAVAGGAAVLCTGTYLVTNLATYDPITLVQDSTSGAKDEYNTAGKIGKDFEHFLVSPFHKQNRQFWRDSHDRFTRDGSSTKTFSSDFDKSSQVKRDFAEKSVTGDSAKALNRACDTVYKKNKSDLTGDDTNGTKKKLLSDLFAYCSVLKRLPTTLKDDQNKSPNYTEGKLGKAKEDKLISHNGNDDWWALKNKEFLSGGEPDEQAKFFKKFHKDLKGGTTHQTLRDRCKDAYDKDSSNDTSQDDKPKSDEVLKYCSLLGS